MTWEQLSAGTRGCVARSVRLLAGHTEHTILSRQNPPEKPSLGSVLPSRAADASGGRRSVKDPLREVINGSNKIPAVTWERLLDGLEIEQRSAVLEQVSRPEVSVDKRSIKAAIDGGVDVPGASLAVGRHSLRRS